MSVATRPNIRATGRFSLALVAAFLFAMVGVGVWLSTQNSGPSIVSQTRSVGPFNAVELAGANVVTVRVGATQSVVVHARQNMLGHVTTRTAAGSLVIANTPTKQGTKGPISVSVAVPSLKGVAIAEGGTGIITVQGINAPSFAVTLAGDGIVRVSGNAAHVDVNVGGSGVAELGQTVAGEAQAVLSGSGRIVVKATQSLDASVTGTGVIQYEGNPARLATSVTGSGAVIPG